MCGPIRRDFGDFFFEEGFAALQTLVVAANAHGQNGGELIELLLICGELRIGWGDHDDRLRDAVTRRLCMPARNNVSATTFHLAVMIMCFSDPLL